MQNKLLATLGCVGLMALAPASNAASSSSTINTIQIVATQYAMFHMTAGMTGGRPACHNATYTNAFSIDLSTNKGRSILSTVTAAKLANRQMSIFGSNTCLTITGYGQIEAADVVTLL